MIPKSEGVSVAKIKAQGWWSGNTTMVTFEEVRVPVENLIGKENKGIPSPVAKAPRLLPAP